MTHDESARARQIIRQLTAQDFSALEQLDTSQDSLLGDLARLGQVWRVQSAQAKMRENGVHEILDMMMQIAGGDFDIHHNFAGQDDLLDALMIGLNMMAEELAAVTLELQATRDSALEASATKSRFLASMSHELRTPLNAIIGYTELIREEAEAEEGAQIVEDSDKILTASRHLLNLISDILDLSKIESGKIELITERFALEDMCQELADTLRPLASERGNTFVMELEDGLGSAITDRTRLHQVLLNLLSNANKFTKGGLVKFSVRRAQAENKLSFAIEDNGIGIAPDRLAAIFEPFVQEDGSTTRKYGGTGLGLAISRNLAQMLGGDICVTSTQGEGSRFEMEVCATLEARTQRTATPSMMRRIARPRPAEDGRLRVMVIDDDPHVHELMRRTFPQDQIALEPIMDGTRALAALAGPAPDLIFLDIDLPEVDGWTILTRLRQDSRLAQVPVVIISIVDNRTFGFALGANEYLLKPLNYAQLLPLLMKLTQGEGQGRVMVVDDEPHARELARRALELAGYEISEASNGAEALELLEHNQPDVILLDLMMPEIDGFELLDRLERHPTWRDIPVVVLSAMDLSRRDMERLNTRKILSKHRDGYGGLYEVISRVLELDEPAQEPPEAPP